MEEEELDFRFSSRARGLTYSLKRDTNPVDKLERGFRRPPHILDGYTGHVPEDVIDTEDERFQHPLEIPYKRVIKTGYSGFIPNAATFAGKALNRIDEPSADEEQDDIEDAAMFQTNFRTYAKNMDISERYANAIDQLHERGQTQQMLIKLVQNKIAERVRSYAEQVILLRLLFEQVDINHDFALDEQEFRQCLEGINVQLDDIQVLALFAYFDNEEVGEINWKLFSDKCMVHNPKGRFQ
jgi:hypothetical protein